MIQLIDATRMKQTLKKNMGKKNCEITSSIREEIIRIYSEMEESEVSHIFPNDEFGYWQVSLLHPEIGSDGKPVLDKKGKPVPKKQKPEYEVIPFRYPGGMEEYLKNEV